MYALKPFYKLSRRNLLRMMFAAGVSAAGHYSSAAEGEDDALIVRTIPSSGERIPALGLGSSGTFAIRSAEDRHRLMDILQSYFLLGGRLIDTAPSYGNAESVIGELLQNVSVPTDMFMATKIDRAGKAAAIDQINNSSSLLHTQPLDLVQVHNLVDVQNQLAVLRELKAQKKIRYYGITHFRVSAFDQLEALIRNETMDFVQLNYSVVTPDAEKRLLPMALDKGIATIINRAFEDGKLFNRTRNLTLPKWASEFGIASWAQFYLKYVLSNPAVTCVIPATSKKRHLLDNMAAGRGLLPDPVTHKRMQNYIKTL